MGGYRSSWQKNNNLVGKYPHYILSLHNISSSFTTAKLFDCVWAKRRLLFSRLLSLQPSCVILNLHMLTVCPLYIFFLLSCSYFSYMLLISHHQIRGIIPARELIPPLCPFISVEHNTLSNRLED